MSCQESDVITKGIIEVISLKVGKAASFWSDSQVMNLTIHLFCH